MKKVSTLFLLFSLSAAVLLSCKSEAKSPVQPATAQTTVQKQQITQTVSKAISAEQFKQAIESGEVQLVDVRTPREYAQSHIDGAINVNFASPAFVDDMIKAGIDKEKPLYIYCLSGARSAAARRKLAAAGFKEVYDMRGGVRSWYQKGYKLVK